MKSTAEPARKVALARHGVKRKFWIISGGKYRMSEMDGESLPHDFFSHGNDGFQVEISAVVWIHYVKYVIVGQIGNGSPAKV